jgi:hypothetical protein
MEKREFTIEDLSGSGQYLVRVLEENITKTSYLSTVMYKVAYHHGFGFAEEHFEETSGTAMMLVAMCDGYSITGEFKEAESEGLPRTFAPFTNKEKLVDYINKIGTYRFATHEELMRVALFQHRRCG